MKKTAFLIPLLLIFLSGCNILPGADVKTDTLEYKIDRSGEKSNQAPVMLNKDLPVVKLTIASGRATHQLEVEVASTDAQRKVGLMNRERLDEGKGMLFLFDTQGYLNFWMKNTLIPLDMVFLDQDGTVRHISKNAQPCLSRADKDCMLYGSGEPVKYVLEVNGGLCDKLGIRVGDKAVWL